MSPDELKEWLELRKQRLASLDLLAEMELNEAIRKLHYDFAAIQLRTVGQMMMIAALSPLP